MCSILFLQSILTASPLVQEPQPATCAEVHALLKELDSFDVSDLQVVRVSIPQGADRVVTRYGFLLHSKGSRFTVRHLDVGTCTYVHLTADAQDQRTHFQPVDVRDWAEETANEARRTSASGQSPLYRSPDVPISSWTRALSLSRVCAERGLSSEAKMLLSTLPTRMQTRRAIQGSVWFAEDMRTRLDLDFADPTLSWGDIVARHDKFLEILRASPNAERVRDRRDMVRRLLARQPPAGTDKSSASDVRDLVRRLCDQFSPFSFHLDSLPIPPRAPLDSYGLQPVDRVLGLGTAAIPALIDSLDDATPTRSVWYCGRMGGFFVVATVGEAAEWTLSRIAGLSRGRDKAAWRAWYHRANLVGLDAAFEETLCPDPGREAKKLRRGDASNALIDCVRTHSGWRQ